MDNCNIWANCCLCEIKHYLSHLKTFSLIREKNSVWGWQIENSTFFFFFFFFFFVINTNSSFSSFSSFSEINFFGIESLISNSLFQLFWLFTPWLFRKLTFSNSWRGNCFMLNWKTSLLFNFNSFKMWLYSLICSKFIT